MILWLGLHDAVREAVIKEKSVFCIGVDLVWYTRTSLSGTHYSHSWCNSLHQSCLIGTPGCTANVTQESQVVCVYTVGVYSYYRA